MREFRFWQVDAFSDEPYKGNPAAIVFDADPLTDDEMQTIARQMNLSETVFFCTPSAGADYRVRIFTPTRELPFAGHPTIAAAFAHSSTTSGSPASGEVELRQECGAGLVPVTVTRCGDGEGEAPLFTLAAAARPTIDPGLSADDVAAMLGCAAHQIADEPAEICSIGLPWLIARVASLEVLQVVRADQGRILRVCDELHAVGLTAYCVEAVLDDCSVHVRTFAPGEGIAEDPVCGSGNGSVAVHLSRHLHRTSDDLSYRAEQGLEVHRRGVLHLGVRRSAGDALPTVRLGGQAVKVLEGKLWI